MVKVKICGLTNLRDALKVHELGADILGFIFYDKSPRKVDTADHARVMIEDLPKDVLKSGLFVNEKQEVVRGIAVKCRLDMVQLHGDETPAYCRDLKKGSSFSIIKSFRVRDTGDIKKSDRYKDADYYLFDAYVKDVPGGTGTKFNWDMLKGRTFKKPFFLAGGLNPENIAGAVSEVAPYAVDVASGVERSPGKKDYKLLKEFIENAKKST